MHQQTESCKTQERADRATYLSMDDVRALEAKLGCCPASYHGMTNFLKRYIRLLSALFGAGCSHLTRCRASIRYSRKRLRCTRRCRPSCSTKRCGNDVGRADRRNVVASVSGHPGVLQRGECLWTPRECFSHRGPGLPESQLYSLRHDLRGCSLRVSINCPVAQLLNLPSGAAVSQAGSGSVVSGGRTGYGGK